VLLSSPFSLIRVWEDYVKVRKIKLRNDRHNVSGHQAKNRTVGLRKLDLLVSEIENRYQAHINHTVSPKSHQNLLRQILQSPLLQYLPQLRRYLPQYLPQLRRYLPQYLPQLRRYLKPFDSP
jgi:hypothetical protein